MTDVQLAELRAVLSKEVGQAMGKDFILADLDSMDVMALAVAIEKYAGLEVGYGEISQCDTYGDLEDVMAERRGEN
jgi:acyl carrier protein